MKFFLASMIATLSLSASAATLVCTSKGSATDYTPTATITAQVDSAYMRGTELKKLTNLVAISGETITVKEVKADASYAPRTNPNRARFGFDLLASEENDFDGIIHGLILPKKLTKSDIIAERSDGAILFKASLVSSTDSYHDGINSYFKASCLLKL